MFTIKNGHKDVMFSSTDSFHHVAFGTTYDKEGVIILPSKDFYPELNKVYSVSIKLSKDIMYIDDKKYILAEAKLNTNGNRSIFLTSKIDGLVNNNKNDEPIHANIDEILPADDIQVGSVIVRPLVMYSDGTVRPIHVNLGLTNENTYVFKATRPVNSSVGRGMLKHTSHWIVGKPTINKSLTCFNSSNLPDNWIGFEVVAFSKNNNAVFTKPVTGTLDDLIAFYSYPIKKDDCKLYMDSDLLSLYN